MSKQQTPTSQTAAMMRDSVKQQTTTAVLSGLQDSFMNESIDIHGFNQETTQGVSLNDASATTKDASSKEKSGACSNPATHRRREIKDKSLTRNQFSFKAVDNLVYTDLLSEDTILSPNYRPPKNPEDRKQICFNSPHNLNGKIKKFVFPAAAGGEGNPKLQMKSSSKLSFYQRYKARQSSTSDAQQL